MHLVRRLWETAKNRRTRRPDPQQQAGRRAEARAARAIQTYGDEASLQAWGALRLPDVGTGRLLEIDVVLAHGTSVVAVELKHWVGRVELTDGRFIQHRSGGRTVNHGRLFDRLDARLQSLEAFLGDRDAAPATLDSYLAFASPDLHLDDDVESDSHRIVVASSPQTGLDREDGADHVADAIHRVIDDAFGSELDDAPGDPDRHDQLTRTLDRAGTWDDLHYHGGRRISGDIDWVVHDDHRLSNRRDIAHIDFHISRSYIDALTSPPEISATLHHRDDTTATVDSVELDDCVRVHPAGHHQAESIPLRHLQSLTFGAPEDLSRSLGWNDLEPGDRHRARISGIVDFGLFVDLGAPTDGLVHISQIDQHRHTNAHELPKRFSDHQLVDVRITDVDREADEISLQLV